MPTDVIGAGTPRGPTLGQKLSAGVGKGLELGQQMYQQHQQRQAMKELGLPENVSPEIAKTMLTERLKGESREKLLQQKMGMLGGLFGGGQSDMQPGNQQMNSADEGMIQEGGFDASQIPDEKIAQAALIDPNVARQLQHAKDVALREKRAKETHSLNEKKFKLNEKKSSPEYQREQHIESAQAQADVKYNAQLQETSKQHELKEQTLNRLEKLNQKGVTGKPYEKLLEKGGLVALTSDGRREFAADVKNLITDIRSILGGQFSNFEFQTILNAYPSADFSKGANEAIIKNLKNFQDIKSKEVKFAEEIKKQNGGKIPPDFQAKVNDRVREYAATKANDIKENTRKIMNEEYGIPPGKILMFDPQGEPLSVSEGDIERYESLGATLP